MYDYCIDAIAADLGYTEYCVVENAYEYCDGNCNLCRKYNDYIDGIIEEENNEQS